jgi:hypothetical protein
MAASLTADEVPKLTVVALREHLAARGLDKKGLKAELVARLTHALLHPSREADGGDDPAEADGGTATATAARPQSLRTQRSAPPGAAPEPDDADGDLPVRRLSPAFGTLADSPVAGLVEPSAVVHKRGGGGVPAATPFHPAQHDSDGTPGTGLTSWVRNSLDSLTKLGTAWGAYLAGSPRGQVPQQQQGGPAPKLLPAAKRDLNSGAPVPVAPGARRVGVVAPAVLSRLGWKPKTGPVDKKARNPTPRKYDAKASIAAKGKLPWAAAARPIAQAPPADKPAARPSPAKPAAARRATLAPGARLAGSKPFMPGGAAKRQSMAFVDAAAARSHQVNAARKRSLR